MATKSLYIGNLSYSTTEEGLRSAFQAYGATGVRIVEGRGFGFVDIEGDKLDQAIADKHNSQLDGRTITVNEARPRENRNGGNRGGYGGGRGGYGGNRGGRGGSRW